MRRENEALINVRHSCVISTNAEQLHGSLDNVRLREDDLEVQ